MYGAQPTAALFNTYYSGFPFEATRNLLVSVSKCLCFIIIVIIIIIQTIYLSYMGFTNYIIGVKKGFIAICYFKMVNYS